ncbi:hypothetical protein FB451DRAFT_1452106 [Mycena latifolia]|nr:hypothetical protein FB451DRAFT_1452106 [Mycena latifolia]
MTLAAIDNAGRSPASDSSFSSSSSASSSATLASSEYSASPRVVPEYIVECVSDTVAFALSSPSARAKRAFVAALPARADVALPTVLSALVYVARARPVLSIALQTRRARTRVFGAGDVGRIEREFCAVLDWELRVGAGEVESVGAALGATPPRAPAAAAALAPSTWSPASSTASASPHTPASAFPAPLALSPSRPRPPPASTLHPAAPRVLVQAARAPAHGRRPARLPSHTTLPRRFRSISRLVRIRLAGSPFDSHSVSASRGAHIRYVHALIVIVIRIYVLVRLRAHFRTLICERARACIAASASST